MLTTPGLMTPLEVHGARSREEYLRLQKRAIANGRAARPALPWRDPWPSGDRPAVFISGGKWVIRCSCGNCPSVHPDWKLACCFECGAIYEHSVMPPAAKAIEAALLKRPIARTRHWRVGETVKALLAENRRHGLAS